MGARGAHILPLGRYGRVTVQGADPCGQPGALTQDEAHQLILRYAVSFLLQYVAGDRRFETLLGPAAAPPGVEFTADTGDR
jgi:hypothetical protein